LNPCKYSPLSRILVAKEEKLQSETIVQGVELARKTGERLILAVALVGLAEWVWRNHQFDKAEAYLKEAQTLDDQIGNKASRVSLLQGRVAHARNDYQQARLMYTKFIEQCDLIGEKRVKSYALQNLGILERDEGNFQPAQSYFEEALKIEKEIGVRTNIGIRFAVLGQIELLQGNLEGAKHKFNESLSIVKEVDDRNLISNPLLFFSNAHANLHPRITVRILGAIHAYYKNIINEPIDPLMTRESDNAIAQACQHLDESAFNAAWAEGEKMSLDEVLDLALKTLEEI
jgi:tetratricopeptide (TPR) repeat protein